MKKKTLIALFIFLLLPFAIMPDAHAAHPCARGGIVAPAGAVMRESPGTDPAADPPRETPPMGYVALIAALVAVGVIIALLAAIRKKGRLLESAQKDLQAAEELLEQSRARLLTQEHAAATTGATMDTAEPVPNNRDLERAGQRLRIALEASGAGIWEVRGDSFYFDKSIADMLRLEMPSPITIAEFLEHLTDISAVEIDRENIVRHISSDTDVRPNLRQRSIKYLLKDGTEMYLENYAKDWCDENGKLDSIIGMIINVTDRIIQQEHERELFSHLLDHMEGGIFVTDCDTDKIIYINNNAKRQRNVTEDAIGKPCWQVMNQNSARCGHCHKDRLQGVGNKPEVWEELLADGTWQMHIDRLINWPDGRVVHLQTGLDITPVKNAEREIEERLNQQTLMSGIAKNFLSSDNLSDRLADALRKTGEFAGCDSARFLLVDPEARALEIAQIWVKDDTMRERALSTQPPFEPGRFFYDRFIAEKLPFAVVGAEYLIQSEEASALRTKSLLAVPVELDGAVVGFLEMGSITPNTNWTESQIQLATLVASVFAGVVVRQRIETDLRHLTTVVEGAPEIIAFVSPDGKILSYNQALLDVTGHSKETIERDGIYALHDRETADHIVHVIMKQALTNGSATNLLPVLAKDGEVRMFDFSSFPIHSEKGTSFGIIGTDFTEQQRLEKELVEAKIAAEKASVAKSRFLFNMSHEMRTPLIAIIGLVMRMKSYGGNPQISQCLDSMDASSKHLLSIITDVLDMCKLETEEFPLKSEPYDICSAVAEAVAIARPQFTEKQQEICLNIGEGFDFDIAGDEEQLVRAIIPLLSNASKFSPAGSTAELSLVLTERQNDDVSFSITVRDSGSGIPPEKIDMIFQPFQQADSSITKKHLGLGLGLSISKHIIEKMGGQILVDSSPGDGSTFTVELTAKALASETYQTTTDDGIVNLTGKNILVVEDVDINAQILMFILEETNADITIAENGKVALDLFEDAPDKYDLIFMDLQMPEMDGYTATRAIRACGHGHGKTVPIYAMTANAFQDDIDESIRSGMNGHISKPVNPEIVYSVLRKHLG